ncbi:MAG: alanine racemase, partial [Lactococcus sp.]
MKAAPHRHTPAIIKLSAIENNVKKMREHIGDKPELWAVVKANAYGHGIERVYQAFKSADGFALLDLAEAKRIRALGWTGPVLLL